MPHVYMMVIMSSVSGVAQKRR